MVLTECHKSQCNTDAPKVIARLVPTALVVAYVINLPPFLAFLEHAVRGSSPKLIWAGRGMPILPSIGCRIPWGRSPNLGCGLGWIDGLVVAARFHRHQSRRSQHFTDWGWRHHRSSWWFPCRRGREAKVAPNDDALWMYSAYSGEGLKDHLLSIMIPDMKSSSAQGLEDVIDGGGGWSPFNQDSEQEEQIQGKDWWTGWRKPWWMGSYCFCPVPDSIRASITIYRPNRPATTTSSKRPLAWVMDMARGVGRAAEDPGN